MVCSVAAGTAAEYYISEQASYYTGGREPPGRWYARASSFDLVDGAEIDDDAFATLHAGRDPATGMQLGQVVAGRHVGGYDVTFSAPKSVSVAWALAGTDTRLAIEQAQERAVRAALDLLNDHAAFARRGHGGHELEKVALTAALFQHGEARPVERADGQLEADPQLHTHAVVMNLAQRGDRSWGALDGRHFYHWKLAAGALYRAELARGLMEMGFSIERTRDDGLFEMAGVPADLCSAFSARRTEIEAILGSHGSASAALAGAITRATRETKRAEPDRDRHERWRARAAELGVVEADIETLRHRPQAPQSAPVPDVLRALTEHESTFDLRDLHAAVAAAMTGGGAGAAQARGKVSRLVDSGSAVLLGRDELGQSVYSTPEMVRLEAEVDRLARSAHARRFRGVAPTIANRILADHALSDEQRHAVTTAVKPNAVAVIEGAAGSGKSTSLRAVADAYREAGCRVIGMADAWRAARQLAADCNIEARATAAWLATADGQAAFLDRNTVLLVDEAGLLSSRQIHRVLTLAEEAGAKVILSGDQRQLQAIGAGPGLKIVADAIGTTRIDTIRRQREAWMRKAVAALADGRAAEGLTALAHHGRLHWQDRPSDAVRACVETWKRFVSEKPAASAVLIARTNAQVRALNAEMRQHLKDQGMIAEREVIVAAENASGQPQTLTLARGEQIRFLTRHDRLGVINGSIARVRHVVPETEGHARIVAAIEQRTISFSTRELAAASGRAKLTHAYATTLYTAQGVTVDATFVVADPSWGRNDIYVGLSRGRDRAELFVDRRSVDALIKTEAPLADRARLRLRDEHRLARLTECFGRARVKTSTLDWRPHAPTRPPPVPVRAPPKLIRTPFPMAER
jgi:conjugative relaxase-like TrwC/TraI family protein